MKLPARTWGRGEERVVFLHGFTGSRFSFDHLEPLLGESVRATCLELPGHHEAPLPQGDFGAVIDQVAAQLEGADALIGYSQGARVALGVACRHPALVKRLVLESGSPGLHRRHDRVIRRRSDAALAELIAAHGVDSFIARWEQLPLFAGIRALPNEVQRTLRERRIGHSPEGLAAALQVMGQGAQPDFWPQLPTLRIPTLLITGAADQKYTRLARRMAAELPLAWRVSLRGVGHAPHLEAPGRWADEVGSFLRSPWTDEPSAEVTR